MLILKVFKFFIITFYYIIIHFLTHDFLNKFIELVKEMHHYWIMNNLSSILLKNWTMVMRIFFFYILSFIYFIICLFVLNRTTYVVVGYNMFDEELMKNKIGI